MPRVSNESHQTDHAPRRLPSGRAETCSDGCGPVTAPAVGTGAGTGTAGAAACVMNAVNDALAPFGASVTEIPITPELVLRALGQV